NVEGSSRSRNTPSNVAPAIITAGASYRFSNGHWPVEIGGSVRHVASRFLFEDDATTMEAYTTGDVYAFVDIPGRDTPWQGLDKKPIMFRDRHVAHRVYAPWSVPDHPDLVYLDASRTYE